MPVKVGVLALQGAFARHAAILGRLGAEPIEVRSQAALEDVAALILPGGESTTMSMLLESSDLFEPIGQRIEAGMPVLGTCAGMILLAREVLDGRADQRSFGVLDVAVRRNAFGRQVDSFEADLAVESIDDPDQLFPGVFIRAPVVEQAGPGVDVLARVDGRPVLCRSGGRWAAAFHPELSGDDRIHARFLQEV